MNSTAFGALFSAELKLIFRNFAVAISATLVPIAACLAVLTRGTDDLPPAGWGAPVAIQLILFLGLTACMTSAGALAQRRNDLYLKRLRSGCARETTILLGLLGPVLAVTVGQSVIMLVITGFAGSGVPANPLLLVLVLVAGIAVAVPIGVAASGFSSTAEQAQTVALPFMLLLIGSAIWAAMDVTSGLSSLQLALPGGAIMQLSHLAYDPAGGFGGQLADALPALAVLVVWSAVGVWTARRYFRWEPRKA